MPITSTLYNLSEEERIVEDEIILNEIDRVIALEEYLPGGYFGVDKLNPLSEATIKPKSKKKDKNYLFFLFLGVVLLVVVVVVVYFKIRKTK